MNELTEQEAEALIRRAAKQASSADEMHADLARATGWSTDKVWEQVARIAIIDFMRYKPDALEQATAQFLSIVGDTPCTRWVLIEQLKKLQPGLTTPGLAKATGWTEAEVERLRLD